MSGAARKASCGDQRGDGATRDDTARDGTTRDDTARELVRAVAIAAAMAGSGALARPRPVRWMLGVALAIAILLQCGGVALAASSHVFVSSLSEAPPGTKLMEPGAVAVDHATGQVFVGDLSAGYVDVYSAAGSYETQFGEGLIEPKEIAVDEANGDVYVPEPVEDAVLVYEPVHDAPYRLLGDWRGQNTPSGRFGEVEGVAFDNSKSPSDPAAGDVYVVEAEGVNTEEYGAVDLFKPMPNPEQPEEIQEGQGPEGEFVRRLAGPKLEEPNGVAVDSANGRVLVADGADGAIYTYSDAGAPEAKLSGSGSPYGSFEGKEEEEGNVAGLAIDEGSGEIYVAESERHAVSQYSEAGLWEGWTTTGESAPLGEPLGVALTAADEVLVADGGTGTPVVDRFGVTVAVPDVETGKVAKGSITRTTAVAGGTVNGDGKPTTYRVEYGESEAYGQQTAPQNAGNGEEAVSVSIAGLRAGTTYYYRLVAEDQSGAGYGIGGQFTTAPAVESLSTGAAKNVLSQSATVTGSLKRGGLATSYRFQYGTSALYGRTSAGGEVPAGKTEKEEKEAKALETTLTGLTSNTTYHYRLVAENSYGTTFGGDAKFTTSGRPRITNEAATGLSHEGATIHAKVDPDKLATTYRFEYGETSSYGAEVPLGGQSIGEGETPVAVSATLASLKIGTTYHYRVVAENSAGVTLGADQTFETIPPAPIDATYASEVSATEATLHTEINPLGRSTSYYFQYGTASCSESPGSCTNVPTAPAVVGAGEGDVAESAQLQGLLPSTTYHYRVIDSNSLGSTEGRERTFTTAAGTSAFALPDGRAWEMVSPPDKQGAPVEGLTREGGVILAAEDGDALTYVVNGSLDEESQGNRSPEWQQVLATRTASGWASQDIATPGTKAEGVTPGQTPEYQFFTPDLSSALVEPVEGARAEPPLAPGVTQATIYLRESSTGAYLPLVSEADVAAGTQFGAQIHFVSATPDLSHVVIASKVALLGAGSGPGLYEWSSGALQQLSILPSGAPASGLVELGYFHVAADAISNDGSRVIWTTPEENAHRGHLYLRDTVRGETIELDTAQGVSEPPGGGVAQFQSASRDGSRVLFTDKEQLTPNSTAEPTFPGKADLYQCEIVEEQGKLACRLSDLTAEQGEGEHAAVQGFVFGASEDDQSVYLVAQAVLASNRNGSGEVAAAGQDNLYSLRLQGDEWTRTFIATLSGEDGPEWEGNQIANSAYLTARVSPNGRYLAFMSSASLTGYDNTDQTSGKPDEEVYLYDSATSGLRCVSCNPTGARPNGVQDSEGAGEGLGLLVDRRKVWFGRGLAGNIPGWTAENLVSALYQSRYLTDEGRLYFNSPDDLVPQATNGKEDVYEYEPAGVGSCESPSGGCVALISGGASDHESAFLEANPSGSNVFFVTEAQLLPQDTDTAFDIYDAHECTAASPCLSPQEGPTPGCGSADACRPAEPARQGAAEPTLSAVFSGPGSAVAPAPPPKHESQAAKKTAKPLTMAQKLANALRSCRKRHAHAKKKRAACERTARRRYRVHKGKKTAAKGKKTGAKGKRKAARSDAGKASDGRSGR
jgi:phosphodiesterase/alkaline phosphatase D-like protein